ncbi:uncharacterized protein [Rutidosis leptorrhynchoides]|uniref:uncharacterized protein n=1 Tax=Rutidosis leptorrhynchoides TaxID=125765 RepID=UPI003A992118
MLADSCLPITFWGKAVSTACYVMNRVLVVKRYGKTCYELLHKRKPNIKHLETFGAPCTILVRDTGGKFNSKVVSGIFLGYGNPKKRVYNTESKCVEERFEVDIQRNAPARVSKGFAWQFEYDKLFDSFNLPPEITDEDVIAQMLFDSQNSTEDVITVPRQVKNPVSSLHPSTQSVRGNTDLNVERVVDTDEDTELEEDEEVNLTRLTEEHANPLYNQPPTVTVSEQPTKAGGVCRSNRVIMLPIRLDDYLVDTKGIPHIGIPRTNTNESSTSKVSTASDLPVVSESSTAAEDEETNSANVVTAFYSSLNKMGRVFVHAHSCYICQIEPIDAFEALKYDEWVSAMQEELLQFKHLKVWRLVNPPHGCEPYGIRWVLKNKKDEQGIVYVDDIIFGSTDQGMANEFEKRFQVETERPNKTLLSVNNGISPDCEGAKVDPTLYRAIIGSLMYITANPNVHHMFVVKKSLWFLKDTPSLGLWYPSEDGFELTAYSDSNYGGCKKDFKSTSGGCQFLGSKLVSWQCKKQTTVAQSTCEAEYIAAASCTSQVIWIQQQLRDYGIKVLKDVVPETETEVPNIEESEETENMSGGMFVGTWTFDIDRRRVLAKHRPIQVESKVVATQTTQEQWKGLDCLTFIEI